MKPDDRWRDFIAGASTHSPDDAFVRLLRERIASGCALIRINLAPVPGGVMEYLILLSYQKVLQEMRVPHSAAFTRWCFESGGRLETAGEETRRFQLLVAERLEPLVQPVGRDYFDAVLVQRLRELSPPKTVARLETHFVHQPHAGNALLATVTHIDATLGELSAALRRDLGYSIEETADILDGALASWVEARFHISERQRLFPDWR